MKKLIIILCLFAFNAKAQPLPLPIIAVYGTSVDNWYGVMPEQSWPYLFKLKLNGEYQIKNYSIIGASYCVSSNPITLHKWQVQEASIVVLGGATNDGAYNNQAQANINFKSRWQANVDSIRKWNPEATIYCITAIKVNSNPYISQANIDLRNMQVRYMAQLNGITVWSADQLPASILSPDGVHPNAAGLAVMADFFHKEFTSVIPTTKPTDIVEPVNEDRVVPITGYPYNLHFNGRKRTLHKK